MNKLTLIICCVGVFFCVSCTNDYAKHPKDMLRTDLGNEPSSLDPQLADDASASRVLFDLFAGLVDFDQQNKIIPGLASSYDVSADGKTYTFHLRRHLRFSNGLPITAHDFVYSWVRVVNPKIASPHSYVLENIVNAKEIIKGKLPAEKLGVYAPNKLTFVVHLLYPDREFINYCAEPSLMVVPETVIERYGASWTEPQHIATSGAYMLKQHVVNGYILTEKNPRYYAADDVKIEKIKYFTFVDINTALDAYKAGDIDTSNVPIDATAGLKHDSNYAKQLHIVKEEGIYYLDYNMHLPIFAKNLKLRQALSMAIDRETLVNQVLSQGQTPLYSFATATIENGKYATLHYDWALLPANERINLARQLYHEAGYSTKVPLHLAISYNISDLNKKVILAIAAMWEKNLGIKVEMRNRGWDVFLNERRTGNYTIVRDAWFPDYDSVTAYTLLYACNGVQNRSFYCNHDYDTLIRIAKNNKDELASQVLYTNALLIALNDYPVIPLFEYSYTRLVKPYVHGYDISHNYLDHVQSKWFSLAD